MTEPAPPRISETALARLAVLAFGLSTLLFAAGVFGLFVVTTRGGYTWRQAMPDALVSVALLAVSAFGLVIAKRQPRNAIGWILLGVGVTWQLDLHCQAYLGWAELHPGSLPGAGYVAAVLQASWVPGIAPIGTFVLLLFPDGHVPTSKWRWWARLTSAVIALAFAAMLVFPGVIELDGMPPVQNPLGAAALEPVTFLLFVPIAMIPVCIVGCAVAIVRRYRRSRGAERLQLKWLAAAAAVVATVYFVSMIAGFINDLAAGPEDPPWLMVMQNVSVATFFLIPIAVAVAILRYRLYDIDRLINRALVYGAVSVVLAVVYVLGVVGAGATMRAVTGSEQGNLAVAGSTLAVAALFRPFRTRVQRFIDRRFYRGKYNAALTVEAFSARLRQETDLAALSDELRDVINQTVQPARVNLWIATTD